MNKQDSHQAKIYGQPLQNWPKNLFIPPDALAIMLDSFEGPLDLLWYLIRQQRLDILDIPMVNLAEQYLIYIEAIKKHTLELAAEYLLMAAWLTEIKARLLLPKPISEDDEKFEDDPRAALVARLLAYEQMRQGAERLAALPRIGVDFEAIQVESSPTAMVQPDVDSQQLHEVFTRLLERQTKTVRHIIERESLSLRDVMATVMRELPESSPVEWESLLALWPSEPFYAVSLFIGLLQLIRERTIEGEQKQPLDNWHIVRSGRPFKEDNFLKNSAQPASLEKGAIHAGNIQ